VIASQALLEDLDALLGLRQDLLDDPYPLYHRMQAEAPVLRHQAMVIVTRFADVEAVTRDLDAFSNRRDLGSRIDAALERTPAADAPRFREFLRIKGMWLASTDPPLHTRIRTLAHKAFTPRHVAGLAETMVTVTDQLIDGGIAADGSLEVVDGLAYELPLFIIGSMLGAPVEDRKVIRRWSSDIAAADATGALYTPAALDAMDDFRAYLVDLIAARRRTRHTDLLAALVEAEEDGDRLDQDELVATFMQLLWAGHETTTNLIGNLLQALFTHPDQMALLRDDLELIPRAVEEILRWNTSVQTNHRVALENAAIAGERIPPGYTVRLLVGAANRDPARFPDPDRFDILREGPAHFGFGLGPHYCLGASLARLETATAVRRLLERFPAAELAEPVHFRPHATLRGPARLRIALHA
jgi:cytochrome P450